MGGVQSCLVRGQPGLNRLVCRGLTEKKMSDPAREEGDQVSQLGFCREELE